jgi:hypothetical protein
MTDFRKMSPLRNGFPRYAVYSHPLASADKIGEVRKIEVDKNPWSDRQPVIKWAAYKPDGELCGTYSTRREAANRLVSR